MFNKILNFIGLEEDVLEEDMQRRRIRTGLLF